MPYQQTLDRRLMFAGRAVLLLVAAAIVSACGDSNNSNSSSAPASSSTGLFDDFNADMIDRTKWANLEFVRQVDNGVLESALASFGAIETNTLLFIDPDAVDAFQADVTVTEVSNMGAIPRARLAGFFYNDGTGTPDGGATGDVFASTEIHHDGTQLVVALVVFLCGTPDCESGRTLLFDDTTFGPVALGETHTLSLAYDGWETFTFGFDGVTTTFNADRDTTPAVPRRDPARDPFKGLQTRVSGIDALDEGAFIAATFDNVMVDGSLYDDFESGRIDRTRWANLEFVRQVDNGVLESALTRFGSARSNNLNFIDPDAVDAMQADVTVTEVSNTNASARARLGGNFYNDGTPGGGEAGEVFADIGLRHDGTQLIVGFQVFLCGDPACSDAAGTQLLFDTTTFGPVAVGETHTLSLAYDGGTVFTFGFDGATTSFNADTDAAVPVPRAGPSQSPFKAIGTRVTGIAGPDEGASIAATFDNVVRAQVNLIVNGNFDAPDISGSFQTLNSSPPDFGWFIVSDGTPNRSATTGFLGVDLINTFWTGTGGTNNVDEIDQSVDIDGASSISQSFETTIGQDYTVEFSYSHHFQASSSTGSVAVEGNVAHISESLIHDAPNNSAANMMWMRFSATFTADSATTTLTIQGEAANGSLGFAVDDVKVVAG